MKRLTRVTLTLAAALSCGQALAVTRGGQLVYGRYADSLFLDPVLNDANLDIWILTNLYDTLLQPTTDGKGVQPGLASRYSVSKDGKVMTLTLRAGLKFADGSALTAQDVKWSLDRAVSVGGFPTFQMSAGSLTKPEQFVVVDDHTDDDNDDDEDRKSTRLNSSHSGESRMPSSA